MGNMTGAPSSVLVAWESQNMDWGWNLVIKVILKPLSHKPSCPEVTRSGYLIGTEIALPSVESRECSTVIFLRSPHLTSSEASSVQFSSVQSLSPV